ncbi:unnamed protein product [Citrullus colocynthis]|uniref:Uncharacterized protein n=1 Tax=Citrullus colocynthis TaxID=252529 RepID=A0ABP0ZCK4_9ROSI
MGIGLNFLFPPCVTLKSDRPLGFFDCCHMSPPVCFSVHPSVVFEVLPGCLGAAYVRAKGAPRPRVLTLHATHARSFWHRPCTCCYAPCALAHGPQCSLCTFSLPVAAPCAAVAVWLVPVCFWGSPHPVRLKPLAEGLVRQTPYLQPIQPTSVCSLGPARTFMGVPFENQGSDSELH